MAFDYQTAADLVCGKRISDEAGREFVYSVKLTHDTCERLKSDIADLRAELARRDAEIALLKGMLLELESQDAQG